jgi:hypothetical protein
MDFQDKLLVPMVAHDPAGYPALGIRKMNGASPAMSGRSRFTSQIRSSHLVGNYL